MAASIHNANEVNRLHVNQLPGKRVNNKNNDDSAAYKSHRHEHESPESEEDKQHRGQFSQGLEIFMDTTLPGKKMLAELTGIAEMDALGLQFFIAMQRQFVRLRLSQLNEHGDS